MGGDAMETVEAVLDALVEGARRAFGAELASVVLFGSAAERRLRSTSDVNLLLLLERFAPAEADAFRASLRTANTAVRARVMFLERAELAAAAELFAVKFLDIRERHRVLFGIDPFAGLVPDDAALRRRLR